MKKRAARKDFIMEIKKSPGRFLSILFIVALGVAFFSGIRASEPDMRMSGDSYFDDSNLMDLKALSTYGVTEDDVEAFGELSGISYAEGAYSADFLYNAKDEQQVIHVLSLPGKLNQVTVSEGRLPEKEGECLVDDFSDWKIGDEITLESGTDDPVSDTLHTSKFTVVGRGNSPCYISYGRGSASIGTGSISAFLFVPEETFSLDVYTEVYMQVEGAKALTEFTDAYSDKIEEVQTAVEDTADERGVIRKKEVVDEANEKLADAKKDLKEGKRKAKKKLKKAKKKIDKAEKQLADAKKEIADGRKQIKEAKATLNEKQKEIDQGRKEYKSGKKKIKKAWKQYRKGLKKYNKQEPSAKKKIEKGRSQANALKKQIAADQETYQTLKSQIAKLEKQLSAISQSAKAQEDSDSGNGSGSTGEEGSQESSTGNSGGKESSTGEKSTEGGKSDGAGSGGSGASQAQIAALKQQLATLRGQASGMSQKISAEKKAYNSADKELTVAEKKLSKSKKELDDAKAELESQEKKLKSAKAKLDSGQKQIDKARKELKTQEKKLDDGEKEIKENEEKLADAKKEYKKGKKKAEKEIADGEQKIKDAQEEIDDIEDPEWYVYDRSTLVEHDGFGENAERLGAIGKVFPVLFFLVAALISLTSMTRMVEEQRINIGTMKALGYGKMSIASKYLGYALLATAGGSILGVLVGEKVLPYIIVYAYGILYQHLPAILVPYNWKYALMASGISVVCVLFATFFSCIKELHAQPSELMRPPAPKSGRRVLLERIGILWKHLNFTWKSTIRNLMRYKKRFFMTIFGIGGCMALMLVGFGLKDSCYEIATLQYEDIQLYDASIYLEEDITDAEKEQIVQKLADEEGVTEQVDADMQSITLMKGKKEREAYECVFRSTEKMKDFVDFHDRKTKEEYTLSDHGAIISEKTAKLLDAKEGDTIYIKDEDNGNKKVKIEHICENYLGHYIYLTPAYYEEVYGEKPEYNSIFFSVKDESDKDGLEKTGKDILPLDGVLSVSYMHDVERQLDDMLKSLNLVIVVLIISAGMLAFVVLYNLNTVNIAERKRELATLKVLGFYNREVAEYVYRENILLTFLGAVVGCGLGKFLHRFIIETVEVDSAMFGRNINLSSYLYSLLLTVAFSLLINGVMYFKLKKINMVESLKSVE